MKLLKKLLKISLLIILFNCVICTGSSTFLFIAAKISINEAYLEYQTNYEYSIQWENPITLPNKDCIKEDCFANLIGEEVMQGTNLTQDFKEYGTSLFGHTQLDIASYSIEEDKLYPKTGLNYGSIKYADTLNNPMLHLSIVKYIQDFYPQDIFIEIKEINFFTNGVGNNSDTTAWTKSTDYPCGGIALNIDIINFIYAYNLELLNTHLIQLDTELEILKGNLNGINTSTYMDSQIKKLDIIETPLHTLIHELAHIYTITDDQINNKYCESRMPRNKLLRLIIRATTCEDFSTFAGCTYDNSYINQFEKKFWLSPKNNNYVSDYASTSVDEDFAETFLFYCLDNSASQDSVVKEKFDFFDKIDLFKNSKEKISLKSNEYAKSRVTKAIEIALIAQESD